MREGEREGEGRCYSVWLVSGYIHTLTPPYPKSYKENVSSDLSSTERSSGGNNVLSLYGW